MIKLGELTTKACNKRFPSNWVAIAKMVQLKYELTESEDEITIFLDEINDITIDKNNNIKMNAPIPNEIITALIIEAVKNIKNKNRLGEMNEL